VAQRATENSGRGGLQAFVFVALIALGEVAWIAALVYLGVRFT
jgi:hypothetical protein